LGESLRTHLSQVGKSVDGVLPVSDSSPDVDSAVVIIVNLTFDPFSVSRNFDFDMNVHGVPPRKVLLQDHLATYNNNMLLKRCQVGAPKKIKKVLN